MLVTSTIECPVTHMLDMIIVEIKKHRLGGRDFVMNSGQQLVQVSFVTVTALRH